jgi:hypothetical protein
MALCMQQHRYDKVRNCAYMPRFEVRSNVIRYHGRKYAGGKVVATDYIKQQCNWMIWFKVHCNTVRCDGSNYAKRLYTTV